MSTDQISQSLSLLHTYNALSLKSVMLELGVTRSQARQIMEGVATQMDEGYSAVRIAMNDEDSRCVNLGNTGSIFSIIRSPKESSSSSGDGDGDALQATVAANEKSLADQRDLSSTSDGWAELIRIFSDAEIRPAEEYLEGGVIRLVARDRGGIAASGVASTNGASSANSRSSKPAKKGKETTAAAFFGSKATTKKETKKTTAKDTNVVKGKENNKSTDESKANAETASKSKSKKESNAVISQKKSANVDDFVGDEDEDEEFLQVETERKARVAREARKQVRASATNENAKKRNTSSLSERRKSNPNNSQMKNNDDVMDIEEKKRESDDEEIEYDDCVKKPMDAFTKRANPISLSGGGAKKRRKRLVEKTIMENGYLKTVTEGVWEEYEEEEKALPAASTKMSAKPTGPKNTGQSKGKKQGNLMGFFGKK